MKKDKKVELTKDLYTQINNETALKIVELKEEKEKIMGMIEEELEIYNELLEKRKEIDRLLNQSRGNLQQESRMKFSVSRKLSKQNRRAKNLNRIFTKGLYINLSKFDVQEPEIKKR